MDEINEWVIEGFLAEIPLNEIKAIEHDVKTVIDLVFHAFNTVPQDKISFRSLLDEVIESLHRLPEDQKLQHDIWKVVEIANRTVFSIIKALENKSNWVEEDF